MKTTINNLNAVKSEQSKPFLIRYVKTEAYQASEVYFYISVRMDLRYFFKRKLNMFKEIILPIQAWLLSQEKCISCGQSLRKKGNEKRGNKIKKVSCQCGRIFIYKEETKKYFPNSLDYDLKEPA